MAFHVKRTSPHRDKGAGTSRDVSRTTSLIKKIEFPRTHERKKYKKRSSDTAHTRVAKAFICARATVGSTGSLKAPAYGDVLVLVVSHSIYSWYLPGHGRESNSRFLPLPGRRRPRKRQKHKDQRGMHRKEKKVSPPAIHFRWRTADVANVEPPVP